MNEVDKISNQILSAYHDGFWGGGSIRDLFQSFNASEASSYPIPEAHSIWEIALHISAWYNILVNRVINIDTEYHYDDDWPKPDSSTDENWSKTLDNLNRSNKNLADVVRNLKDEELKLLVPGEEFTFYEMLHGISQHDQYHAGQVVFLKKILQNKRL